MFVDRTKTSTAYLNARLLLFTLGAVLVLLGMAWRQNVIVWVGIGVLALGFAARFLGERASDEGDDSAGPEDA